MDEKWYEFRKTVIKIITVLLIIVFLPVYDVKASVNCDEFETLSMTKEQITKIWDSINLRSASSISSSPIINFDVSESNNIVIALDEKKILIKNQDNRVLNCYEFDSEGIFYVSWNGDNILLFLVRGSVIVEFSLEGQLINMVDCDTHSIKNSELWRAVGNNKKVSANGFDYNIKNNMGILNIFSFQRYSQLIRTDSVGNETIFYDVSQSQLEKIVFRIVVVIIMIIAAVMSIVYPVIRAKKFRRITI